MVLIAGGILLAVCVLVIFVVVGGWWYEKFERWRFNSEALISHAIVEYVIGALVWTFTFAVGGSIVVLIRWGSVAEFIEWFHKQNW